MKNIFDMILDCESLSTEGRTTIVRDIAHAAINSMISASSREADFKARNQPAVDTATKIPTIDDLTEDRTGAHKEAIDEQLHPQRRAIPLGKRLDALVTVYAVARHLCNEWSVGMSDRQREFAMPMDLGRMLAFRIMAGEQPITKEDVIQAMKAGFLTAEDALSALRAERKRQYELLLNHREQIAADLTSATVMKITEVNEDTGLEETDTDIDGALQLLGVVAQHNMLISAQEKMLRPGGPNGKGAGHIARQQRMAATGNALARERVQIFADDVRVLMLLTKQFAHENHTKFVQEQEEGATVASLRMGSQTKWDYIRKVLAKSEAPKPAPAPKADDLPVDDLEKSITVETEDEKIVRLLKSA